MNPTNKLRFINRTVKYIDGSFECARHETVLQQLWDNGIGEYVSSYEGEWRDVPTEFENPRQT